VLRSSRGRVPCQENKLHLLCRIECRTKNYRIIIAYHSNGRAFSELLLLIIVKLEVDIGITFLDQFIVQSSLCFIYILSIKPVKISTGNC
jgi:hypothetical protein